MKKDKFLVFLLIAFLLLINVINADVFKIGSYGAEVRELQLQLDKLGYFEGNQNGVYGLMTEAAVKKFQVKNGFIATGQVDSALAKRIEEAAGVIQENVEEKAVVKSNVSEEITKDQIKNAQLVLKDFRYYTGQIDGLYGPKTAAAIRQFQEKYSLVVDGKLDKETYDAIVVAGRELKESNLANRAGSDRRQNAKEQSINSQGVELLDWWTEASQIFNLGAAATVIDVRTGKSFKLARTYGTNHADCEALTEEDSQIIKEIWGGQWSWNRRPVIIEIEDRKLAASMSAMPHAGLDNYAATTYVKNRSGGYGAGLNLDMIKNNGMDGHIDIHFLNSRTHGSNTVNKAHQEAVMEAFGQ